MFEVPNAKRVKRSEALSSDHLSPSPDPSTQAPKPDYGFDYDFITPDPKPPSAKPHTTTSQQGDRDTSPQPPAEAFEFRLFSSTAPSKFIIESETPASDILLSEGRFTHPNRPDSHYFTSATDPSILAQRRDQISTSAITADEILKQSLAAWPGAHLPWRVTHLSSLTPTAKPSSTAQPKPSKSPSSKRVLLSSKSVARRTPSRSKPSKKRRIILRQRLAARSSLKQSAAEAEEAERLKRNVRNREKKIKRRERERRKKAEARGGEDGAEEGAGHVSGDDARLIDEESSASEGENARGIVKKRDRRSGGEADESGEEESRTKAVRK